LDSTAVYKWAMSSLLACEDRFFTHSTSTKAWIRVWYNSENLDI
jgi:hypothetical protein